MSGKTLVMFRHILPNPGTRYWFTNCMGLSANQMREAQYTVLLSYIRRPAYQRYHQINWWVWWGTRCGLVRTRKKSYWIESDRLRIIIINTLSDKMETTTVLSTLTIWIIFGLFITIQSTPVSAQIPEPLKCHPRGWYTRLFWLFTLPAWVRQAYSSVILNSF